MFVLSSKTGYDPRVSIDLFESEESAFTMLSDIIDRHVDCVKGYCRDNDCVEEPQICYDEHQYEDFEAFKASCLKDKAFICLGCGGDFDRFYQVSQVSVY